MFIAAFFQKGRDAFQILFQVHDGNNDGQVGHTGKETNLAVFLAANLRTKTVIGLKDRTTSQLAAARLSMTHLYKRFILIHHIFAVKSSADII